MCAIDVNVGDIVSIEDGEEAEELGVIGEIGVLVEIDLREDEDLPYLVRLDSDLEWWVESVRVVTDDECLRWCCR